MNNDKIQIFDRNLLKIRRNRASGLIDKSDFLYKIACEDIADRIFDDKINSFLEIGSRKGFLRKNLLPKNINFYIESDLSFKMLKDNKQHLKVVFDEENIPFKDKVFDIVASPLTMHWVNDLPGSLIQIRNTLKPQGMIFLSFLGYRTLDNIKRIVTQSEIEISGGASTRFAPLIDVKTLGSLVQRVGFKDIVCDSQLINVHYDKVHDLFLDLRNMGETNILKTNAKIFSKELIDKVATNLTEPYDDNGHINANFEIVTVTASI